MKKILLITALVVITALVIGCASKEAPASSEPTVTEVKLSPVNPAKGEELPDNEKAEGKGWIIGDDFQKVMNAKAGSKIRLTVTGTENLNWDTIGAVGINDMGHQTKRVDFRPKSGGTYTVDIDIAQLLTRIKGEDKGIGVNIWGNHKVVKVELVLL